MGVKVTLKGLYAGEEDCTPVNITVLSAMAVPVLVSVPYTTTKPIPLCAMGPEVVFMRNTPFPMLSASTHPPKNPVGLSAFTLRPFASVVLSY